MTEKQLEKLKELRTLRGIDNIQNIANKRNVKVQDVCYTEFIIDSYGDKCEDAYMAADFETAYNIIYGKLLIHEIDFEATEAELGFSITDMPMEEKIIIFWDDINNIQAVVIG